MARKSARMLRKGMTVIIDGQVRKITAVTHDDATGRVVITCGTDEFRRTFGAKIDIVSIA